MRAVVGGEVGGQGVEQLLGLVRGAGLQQREREVELELVACPAPRRLRARRRTTSACGSSGAASATASTSGAAGAAGLDAVVLEELAHLAFRQRAGEAVDDLAVLDQEHGRDRADLERRAELRLLVDIDLGQLERAVVVGGEFLQDRAELLARPAPLGPEIDQHRGLHRFLQHFGLEAVGGGVEDMGLGGASGVMGGVRSGDQPEMMPDRLAFQGDMSKQLDITNRGWIKLALHPV